LINIFNEKYYFNTLYVILNVRREIIRSYQYFKLFHSNNWKDKKWKRLRRILFNLFSISSIDFTPKRSYGIENELIFDKKISKIFLDVSSFRRFPETSNCLCYSFNIHFLIFFCVKIKLGNMENSMFYIDRWECLTKWR
jgi:hypothetical protein